MFRSLIVFEKIQTNKEEFIFHHDKLNLYNFDDYKTVDDNSLDVCNHADEDHNVVNDLESSDHQEIDYNVLVKSVNDFLNDLEIGYEVVIVLKNRYEIDESVVI